MDHRHRLPLREVVFITSLMYHGFRKVHRRKNLKKRRGYIIPATKKEDADGVDLWVKMPRDMRLLPVQITQRGVRHYRKFHKPTADRLADFVARRERQLKAKRRSCLKCKVAFVLVRDFDGRKTNTTIAWGDIKALRYAIAHIRT